MLIRYETVLIMVMSINYNYGYSYQIDYHESSCECV